jgi:hypothetical protein
MIMKFTAGILNYQPIATCKKSDPGSTMIFLTSKYPKRKSDLSGPGMIIAERRGKPGKRPVYKTILNAGSYSDWGIRGFLKK